MDRSDWLKEKRRVIEERMDTLIAPTYDEQWGTYSNQIHQLCIQKFLNLLPPRGTILDAACGTGRYWPLLLEKGHTVVGIDQSREMLWRAQAKFPNVRVVKVGLQEMHYQDEFDGVVCIDAMEFVFPEDWPLVLNHFHRALRAGRYLYFTVELTDSNETANAFEQGQRMGFPVVYGEWVHDGGYHYYPQIKHVKEWLQHTHFQLIDETVGDNYHHFLVQRH